MACSYCGKTRHNIRTCPDLWTETEEERFKREITKEINAGNDIVIKSKEAFLTWLKQKMEWLWKKLKPLAWAAIRSLIEEVLENL